MAQDLTWLLSEKWDFTNSSNNNMTIFNATLTNVTTDGTMKHNHKINNFTSLLSTDETSADTNKFSGTADVHFNDDSA
jgi:hypothetical protein